jgi:hypothetical protein
VKVSAGEQVSEKLDRPINNVVDNIKKVLRNLCLLKVLRFYVNYEGLNIDLLRKIFGYTNVEVKEKCV